MIGGNPSMNFGQALLLNCLGTLVIGWVSLRLLGITAKGGRLLLFSIVQGILISLVGYQFALPGNFTFYASLTYVLLAFLLLRLPIVTALMSRAIGLSLIILGKWLSLPKSLEHYPILAPEVTILIKDYVLLGWITNLVSLLLFCFIAFRKWPSSDAKDENHPTRINPPDLEAIFLGTGLLLLASYFGYILLAGPVQDSGFLYLCISIAALPFIAITYFKRIQVTTKDRALLELQHEQLAVQENAIEAMREQRHEIINELALVSTYIQLGLDDKALNSIDFIAAGLADRYNYVTLPKDAWLATIDAKQAQADSLGIRLITFLEAEAPTNLNEQRLLPKVAANLLDNAFEAVRHTKKPQVMLTWKQVGPDRLLSVRNNGPIIPADALDRVFDYGYSSKPGRNKGWGLAICKRIAAELGGELHVTSNATTTEFTLLLPAKSHEYQTQAEAAICSEEA